jgi:hypothetical protein
MLNPVLGVVDIQTGLRLIFFTESRADVLAGLLSVVVYSGFSVVVAIRWWLGIRIL